MVKTKESYVWYGHNIVLPVLPVTVQRLITPKLPTMFLVAIFNTPKGVKSGPIFFSSFNFSHVFFFLPTQTAVGDDDVNWTLPGRASMFIYLFIFAHISIARAFDGCVSRNIVVAFCAARP